MADLSPIERIRAEVEAVRKEHRRGSAYCEKDKLLWPCPTLRLASDKLALAEALWRFRGCTCREVGRPWQEHEETCQWHSVNQALERVAR